MKQNWRNTSSDENAKLNKCCQGPRKLIEKIRKNLFVPRRIELQFSFINRLVYVVQLAP